MQLREYMTSDCDQLARLFFQTVHSVNAKDYTKEQLDVYPYDREFTKRHMMLLQNEKILKKRGTYSLKCQK